MPCTGPWATPSLFKPFRAAGLQPARLAVSSPALPHQGQEPCPSLRCGSPGRRVSGRSGRVRPRSPLAEQRQNAGLFPAHSDWLRAVAHLTHCPSLLERVQPPASLPRWHLPRQALRGGRGEDFLRRIPRAPGVAGSRLSLVFGAGHPSRCALQAHLLPHLGTQPLGNRSHVSGRPRGLSASAPVTTAPSSTRVGTS